MSRRGFTLMEVLIAMALLSAMGVMMFVMFSLTIQGQEEVRAANDRLNAARTSLNLMARELSMAYLSTHVDEEEERRRTFFDGEQDTVNFTTLAHRRLVRGAKESDQAEVGYSLGRDARYGDRRVLIRREKVTIDDRPGKGGVEEVLAVDVKKLEFEYWDARKEEWNSDWQVDFEDVVQKADEIESDTASEERLSMLPFRVKIKLILEDDDKRPFPLETQTPVYMRRALRFRQVANPAAGTRPGTPLTNTPQPPRPTP